MSPAESAIMNVQKKQQQSQSMKSGFGGALVSWETEQCSVNFGDDQGPSQYDV